jgi:eukaryotic-like serine/threonine-protein kinase
MLGRYALYEKIASGGMASVHIGRLLGPVGFARTVAIKRMHPQFAEDPEFVSMFLDEARLAARIRHPNVVPTLDVVAMAGELFLVMDYVPGEMLSRLVKGATARGERIPPEIVVTMMVGVLHGLHAAHEAKNDQGEPLGIVHRDVSPQNILVGTDGVSRVLDFGVAKAVGRLQTTREGQLKGKLAYMAPEQLGGTVTRATDVYAASVVLWEALTGKRLFQGDNEGHVFALVQRGCDEPPSHHATGVPPGLDAVTMRGLSVDPARRFATARDMALALENAILPAQVSKVGDWVEAAAKETLDERSVRIATIESESAIQQRVAPAQADAVDAARRTPDAPGEPLIPIVEATRTQLSSSSGSSAGRTSLPGARRRSAWLWVAGGLVVLASVGGAVALRGMSGGASMAPTASPAPAVVASAAVATSASPQSSAPSEPRVDVAPVSQSPAAPPSLAPRPTATGAAGGAAPVAARGPTVTPSPKPPSVPTTNCDPPTWTDEKGHFHLKPGCK